MHVRLRFVGGKIPCPYGPEDGDEGLRKNVAFFKEWREKVGPEYPLMLDCYMALTVSLSLQCCDHQILTARLKGQFRCQSLLWRAYKPQFRHPPQHSPPAK